MKTLSSPLKIIAVKGQVVQANLSGLNGQKTTVGLLHDDGSHSGPFTVKSALFDAVESGEPDFERGIQVTKFRFPVGCIIYEESDEPKLYCGDRASLQDRNPALFSASLAEAMKDTLERSRREVPQPNRIKSAFQKETYRIPSENQSP